MPPKSDLGPPARSTAGRPTPRAGLNWSAVLAGLGVCAFLALGFWALTRQALQPGWIEGVVEEKLFSPAPEQQIEVGKGGVSRREVKGTFRLIVRGDDGRDYTVFVGEAAFAANAKGSRIRFQRPPPEPLR